MNDKSDKNKCWICGNIADSEEHKFKSSLLRRKFGKKYKGKNGLLYFSGDFETPVESYKSKELKFPKIICVNCNNNISKQHDLAYDIFVNYIDQNPEKCIEEKLVNFKDIYGENWQSQKYNLYRYFAKHAGCKMITSGTKYDFTLKDISEFILGKNHISTLKISFLINAGFYYLKAAYSDEVTNIYNSPITIFGEKVNGEYSFGGWSSYQWMTVIWIISNDIKAEKNVIFQIK